MQQLPTCSIVVPTLKQADTIGDSLASIFANQTAPEVIVMHGGGDDGTEAAISLWRHRLSYISEKDHGQSDAIQNGFDRTTGEIVAWLNSDDLYFPGAIDRALQVMASDPAIDVYYGHGMYITREGDWLRPFQHTQPFDANTLFNDCAFILQPTVFMRRVKLFEVGGVDRHLHYTMDHDLWCKLAKAGAKFHFDHRWVAAARWYDGTKTTSGGAERVREVWEVCRRYSSSPMPRLARHIAIGSFVAGYPALDRLARRMRWGGDGTPTSYWWIGEQVAKSPFYAAQPTRVRLGLTTRPNNLGPLTINIGDPLCGFVTLTLDAGASASIDLNVLPPHGELAVHLQPQSAGSYRVDGIRVLDRRPW